MKEKPFKLPKEFAEKWLKALRSGEYAQGQNKLCNSDSEYCCLGVAGAICGLSEEYMNDKDNTDYFYSDEVPEEYPEELIYNYSCNSYPSILAGLNDGSSKPDKNYPEGTSFVEGADKKLGYSFEQIAEFVELNTEFY